MPWAIRFCNDRILQTYGVCPAGDVPRHPSQLYEAGLEGLVLFVVLSLADLEIPAAEASRAIVIGLFLVGYGTGRGRRWRTSASRMPGWRTCRWA